MPEDVIYKEVGKSVAVASPGPHVFLFVARCDRRFTTEERAAFETIQQMFPGMEKFLILVFVALDDFHEFPTKELKRQEFAKELSKSGERMTSTLAAAQNKYMAVMNKAKGVTQEESEDTIRDLIQRMINLARQNGNSYYTNAVVSEIKTEVQKLTDEVSRKQHLTPSQAGIKVKQDIVGEEVDPGFLVKVGRAIQNAVTKIKNGAKKIKDACLIM